jgi:amino acid permease
MRFFWAPAAHDDKEAQPLLEKEDTSPLVVFCFVVNSCIGVGFLSLPRAFDKAGLWWASFLCCVMGAISLASSTWVVHTMSNTEALLRYLAADAESGATREAHRRVPDFAITARKNELSQQVAFLFGDTVKKVYLFVLSYLMYTCLWCFASVFAASMAARIPLPFVGANNQFTCDLYTNQSWDCRLLYLEHLVVFAVVCIPCSIVKLQETTGFQIAMAFARFILIGLIVADSVRMLLSAEAPPNFYKYDPTYYPQPSGPMHFGYTREVLSIAVFAFYVQMMIPTTTQTLHNKEGTMLPTVWTAIMFCVVVYLAVGVLVALVFGNDTLPVASLNWRNFTGGQENAPDWANTFSTMLILFPTVDILSAFPLIAFCLGENLSQTAPGLSQRYGPWVSTYWRLLAAVPPIFGAIVIDNVAVLFEYGAIGAWLMIVAFPAACVLRSQSLVDERFGKEASRNNPYKTWLSNLSVIYFVLAVSAVMYAYHLGSFLSHKLGLGLE